MVASGRVAYLTRRAADYGVHTSGPVTIDMVKIRQRKRDIVDSFRGGSERRIVAGNVDLIYGRGSFTGPESVEVKTNSGETRELTAKKIFINAGFRPSKPQVPGLDEMDVLNSTSIMELDVVPEHLLILGGGYIGLEFGQLFRRLGSRVTIVQRGKQYAVAGTVASLDALERELASRARPGSRPAFLLVPGIDVPFHSGVLRDGVAEFRAHLEAGLPERVDPALLVGRYVPNLVPRVFSLERELVEEVRDYVDSAPLAAVLDDWATWSADPGRLCRELLIELLAWQFASPVRWIETQDLLFTAPAEGGVGVERVVEVGVGSAPTVANLARGTLALGDRAFVTSTARA